MSDPEHHPIEEALAFSIAVPHSRRVRALLLLDRCTDGRTASTRERRQMATRVDHCSVAGDAEGLGFELKTQWKGASAL